MARITHPSLLTSGREPAFAAALSVVPGIGQLYNGEVRKGSLFLIVGSMNALAFVLWSMRKNLFQGLDFFAKAMHMSLNQDIAQSVLHINSFSPLALTVYGLLLAFTIFAMKDAFSKAKFMRVRTIYASQSLDISEAAAGSYALHFTILALTFLIVFFFLKSPTAPKQYTEIEFPGLQDPPKPKLKVVEKKMVSTKASEASGKHDELKKISVSAKGAQASKAARSEAKPPAEPVSEPHHNPAPVLPRPVVTQKPAPNPSQVPTPLPSAIATRTQTPAPPLVSQKPQLLAAAPQPLLPSAITSHSNAAQLATPQPQAARTSSQPLSALAPAPASHSSASSSAPIAPGIVRDSTNSGNGESAPTPVPGAHRSPASSNSSGTGHDAPSPRAVDSGSSGKHSLPAPVVAMGDNGTAQEGHGNPQANGRPNDEKSVRVGEDPVDFSKFMADLQRRIKRSWYPPKAPASANCIVIFNVHLNGELSGLRVQRSSGIASYDNAALKAVENSAPFRPLPPGAKEAVDVQFTFDYNVFNGSGGNARRF